MVLGDPELCVVGSVGARVEVAMGTRGGAIRLLIFSLDSPKPKEFEHRIWQCFINKLHVSNLLQMCIKLKPIYTLRAKTYKKYYNF